MPAWAITLIVLVVVGVTVAGLTGLLAPIGRKLQRPLRRAMSDYGLTLHAETRPDRIGMDVGVPLPLAFYFPTAEPPPEDPPEGCWWDWAHRHGGSDVHFTHVLLTLQASRDLPVEVGTPEIHRNTVPHPPGVIRGPAGAGGNGINPRRFRIDLDQPDPIAPVYSDPDTADPRPPRFEMVKDDTKTILVTATASWGLHEWTLDLPCVVDGDRVILHADNNGRSFITVGKEAATKVLWSGGRWSSFTGAQAESSVSGAWPARLLRRLLQR